MTVTFVDTDILIDAARNTETAVKCLEQLEQTSNLLPVWLRKWNFWLAAGAKRNWRKQSSFWTVFRSFPWRTNMWFGSSPVEALSPQPRIADRGIHIIAASAISSGNPLITKNQRDFRFIQDLTLLPYPLGKRKFNQAKSDIFVPGWMDKHRWSAKQTGNSLAHRLLTPGRECYKSHTFLTTQTIYSFLFHQPGFARIYCIIFSIFSSVAITSIISLFTVISYNCLIDIGQWKDIM